MSEQQVLTQYKLNNKTLVFSIKYRKKDGLIYYYLVSFLNNYSDEKILNDLKNIRQSTNFLEWIMS